MYADGDVIPKKLQHLRIVSTPPEERSLLSPSLSLMPEMGVEEGQLREKIRHYVLYHEKGQPPQLLLLPDVRPERPEQWDTKAWDNWFAFGNDKYHIFYPGQKAAKHNPPFALKVSSLRQNGKWVYEDFDTISPELHKELYFLRQQTFNVLDVTWNGQGE